MNDYFAKLQNQYNGLESFVKDLAIGNLRSLLVSGPPGCGKSHMVSKYLNQYAVGQVHTIKGKVTPFSLYQSLYAMRAPGSVLVLDDTDEVFTKTEMLNILKAAMDTSTKRTISWESTRTMAGAPASFSFEGAVILITNVAFDETKNKQAVHLKAVKDRTHAITIGSNSIEDCFKMCAYIVLEEGMLRSDGFTANEEIMLLNFLYDNVRLFKNLSLRTIRKMADLYKIDSSTWIKRVALTEFVQE